MNTPCPSNFVAPTTESYAGLNGDKPLESELGGKSKIQVERDEVCFAAGTVKV